MALDADRIRQLRAALLSWYARSCRSLPWRGESDPYRIWVSEVLLQQTQVATAVPGFHKFLRAFPNLETLAAAPLQSVLQVWQGFGYYRRAEQLHAAAQQLVREGWPSSRAGWSRLPGIGPYTSAAIAAIWLGEPCSAIDANVRRVLARLYAELQPSFSWLVRRSDQLLDRSQPGRWAEALMDLGATVCRPARPACPECPWRPQCAAARAGSPQAYPAPKPRYRTARAAAVLVMSSGGRYLLEQRGAGGLWAGLWGVPAEWLGRTDSQEAALERLLDRFSATDPQALGRLRYLLTHRTLELSVYRAQGPSDPLRYLDPAEVPLSSADRRILQLAGVRVER